MKTKALRYSIITLAAMLLSIGAISLAAASWTGASDGWHTLDPNGYPPFQMLAYDYYDNNTSNSVDLGWGSIHMKNPGTCCLVHARGTITHDGSQFVANDDSILIDENEYDIASVDFGDATYYKDLPSPVVVHNWGCYVGDRSSGGGAVWVAFYGDLSIGYGTFP